MRWHRGSYSNLFPHHHHVMIIEKKNHIMISFLQFWWSYSHFLQPSLIITFSKVWPNVSLVLLLEKQNVLLLVLTLTCKELRYYHSVLTTRKYWTNWKSMTLAPIRELRMQEKSITQSKDTGKFRVTAKICLSTEVPHGKSTRNTGMITLRSC